MSRDREERLALIQKGCDKVLKDLQSLVNRYESLGAQSKQTWDRMKWGNEDVAEIRARLTSNIAILTAYISTSQTTVETKLDKFIEEFRQGRREKSIISLQTVDSLSANDLTIWRSIRKELEDIGIDVAAFEANRSFIIDWLAHAVKTGAFDEQNADDVVDLNGDGDAQEPWSNERYNNHGNGPRIRDPNTEFDTESLEEVTKNRLLTLQESSQAAHGVEDNISRHAEISAQIITSRGRMPRTPVPRVAIFLASLSRPRQRFEKAVENDEVDIALKVLRDETSFQLLSLDMLNWALLISCRRGQDRFAAELIARGADVNFGGEEGTPLWYAAANSRLRIIRLLVDNGAHVDYIARARISYVLKEGPILAPRAALRKDDIATLRLLLSLGNRRLTVHVRYEVQSIMEGYRLEFNLLQEASILGAIRAIRVLLEYGADIDAVFSDHGTALMLAISEGQKDAAELLLDEGANPNFKAPSDQAFQTRELSPRLYRSPMEAAIVSRSPAMIRLLLDHGAVPDLTTLSFIEKRIFSNSGTAYEVEDLNIIRKLVFNSLKAGRQLDTLPTHDPSSV